MSRWNSSSYSQLCTHGAELRVVGLIPRRASYSCPQLARGPLSLQCQQMPLVFRGEDGQPWGAGVGPLSRRPSSVRHVVGFLATEATLVGLLPEHPARILLPDRETGCQAELPFICK